MCLDFSWSVSITILSLPVFYFNCYMSGEFTLPLTVNIVSSLPLRYSCTGEKSWWFFFLPCLFNLLRRSVLGCLPALKVVTLGFPTRARSLRCDLGIGCQGRELVSQISSASCMVQGGAWCLFWGSLRLVARKNIYTYAGDITFT